MKYFVLNSIETLLPQVYAISQYGPIEVIRERLYIPYKNKTYIYCFDTNQWIIKENSTLYKCTSLPEFDLNLFILNNDLFKIFKKNVYDEFTTDELEEFKKVHYRVRREQICFPYINRGQLWYHHLKSSQITELNDWYEAWLDVTETLSEPNTPIWLNDKINKIETEELL